MKQVPMVTSGFFTAPTPVDLETLNENGATVVSATVNETDSKGDSCIRLTQKKST
jgi:hypothetical protein